MGSSVTGEVDARDAPAGRRLGVWPSLLLVAAAFVFGQVPLLLASVRTEHPDPPVITDPIDPTDVLTWGRFDSWLYLEVSFIGPTLEPCSPEYWNPDDLCGTSGWLPLYPALIRATDTVTPLDSYQSAALIARAAFAGELALVWFGVFRRRRSPHTVLALLLASTAAGAIWLSAMFPMSLVALFVTGSLLLISRDRLVLGGLLAGLASVSHTMGIIAIGVGGLSVLLAPVGLDGPRPGLRDSAVRVVRYAAPAIGCYLLMLAWYERSVGAWNAPFLAQEKYGHGVQNPLGLVVGRIIDVFDPPSGRLGWEFVQTTFVAILVVSVVVAAVRRWSELASVERYLVVAALALWLIPLSYGGSLASYHRLEALVMPATILAWRLPIWLQTVLVTAFVVIAYHIAAGFFTGAYI